MGILSVRDRASVGGHFTLYEGLGSVYVVGQFRWTRLRVPASLTSAYRDSNAEFFLGLGVSF